MEPVEHPLLDQEDMQVKFMRDVRVILDELGVDTVEKFQEILRHTKWSVFAEKYFCHADDISLPLILHKWQKDAIDLFQEVFYNPTGDGVQRYIQIIAPRSRGKSVLIGVANAIILIVSGGAMTGIFSPSMQQSENLMSKTKYFIENSKYGDWVLARGKHIAGMTKIFTGAASVGMTNRSFSQAYANNEKTMRGIHLKAAFIDESARMSSHTMKAAIYPMVRRAKAPLICITTPFGRTGPAWEAYNDKKTWNTILIKAVDEEFMSPEELEKELATYGDDQALAAQELMAEFISDENAMFPDKYFPWYYREDYMNMARQDYKKVGDRIVVPSGEDIKTENFEKCNYISTKHYKMSADYGYASNRSAVAIGYDDISIYYDKHGIETSREQFFRVVYFRSYLKPDPDWLENEFIALMKYFHVKEYIPDGLSVGYSELKRLQKRIRREKIRTKIFKTGVKPKRGEKDKRKLGLITTGGQGEYAKLNIINETIRRSNAHRIRLPSDAVLQQDGEDCYELEKEMRAFAKDVTKAGNVIFGRGVNDEPDDRVLTLMYFIFAFSKTAQKSWGRIGSSDVNIPPEENMVKSHEASIENQMNIFGSKSVVVLAHQRRKTRHEKKWGR